MPESHLRHYYKTSVFYLEGLLRKPSNYHAAYVELAQHYVAPGSVILDLGAGTAASSEVLARNFTTVALDLSHLFLKGRLSEHPSNLSRVAGDAQDLPFKPGTFHLVGAFEFVEHVSDVGAVFQEIDRILRPGGFVLIISPNMLSPLNAVVAFLREARRGAVQFSGLTQAVRSWWLTTAKVLSATTKFLMRNVPARDDLHSDMDACYFASPVDLEKWFSRREYQILRYQKGGRTRLGRSVNWLFGSYAPTIYFVAQKPVAQPALPPAVAS